jgi:hypothetical protein
MALDPVILTDQPDTIKWKWIRDGTYTISSAYECQFLGTVQKFPAMDIWKATAEPKSNFLLG